MGIDESAMDEAQLIHTQVVVSHNARFNLYPFLGSCLSCNRIGKAIANVVLESHRGGNGRGLLVCLDLVDSQSATATGQGKPEGVPEVSVRPSRVQVALALAIPISNIQGISVEYDVPLCIWASHRSGISSA